MVIVGMETQGTRPGGLNRYLSELADGLLGEGVAVTAVAATAEPSGADEVPGPAQARFVTPTTPSAPLPLRVGRLWRAAWSQGPTDVLDSHFALYGLGPMLTARARRQLAVVHFQGPWADESLAAGGGALASEVKRLVERAVYRRADVCVVLSEAFGDLLSRRYGVARWAIECIPPGVDLRRFGPGPAAEARAELGIPEQRWVAVAARRLTPRVGLDVLLDAWAEVLRTTDGAAELLVVGDGPQRDQLLARAARADLAGHVRFLGRVDDATLVSAYRAADVSIVPSVSLEGFGLVVLESLACGTPVIASDAGGLPEVLRPLREDLVVPAGDRGALARRIGAAIEGSLPLPDPTTCRDYADTFGWPSVSRRHVELYRSRLDPSGAGRPGRRGTRTGGGRSRTARRRSGAARRRSGAARRGRGRPGGGRGRPGAASSCWTTPPGSRAGN